jgi:hypothetical protein
MIDHPKLDHNPRVGGSSLSAAIHVGQRPVLTLTAKLEEGQGFTTSPIRGILRDAAAFR